MVIDEVQRVPELLLAIKLEVDRKRLPGRFLLTGSAEVRTTGAVAESLAGRMRMLDLLPLSQSEITGGAGAWLEELWDGTITQQVTGDWGQSGLVIEARDGSLCGLEMKLGAAIRAADFVGLRHLQETVGPKFRHGYVVHGGDKLVSFAPHLHALPVSALAGVVGR